MASDLISRAVAIDTMYYKPSYKMAIEVLKEVPAVDAVPVVRCRNCKYAHMTYDGDCKYCDFWQEDGGEALYLDGDFYCAAGERRDGGDGDE